MYLRFGQGVIFSDIVNDPLTLYHRSRISGGEKLVCVSCELAPRCKMVVAKARTICLNAFTTTPEWLQDGGKGVNALLQRVFDGP